MWLVEAFEFELWCFARDREALRRRCAPRQHSGKIRLGPDRRKVDSAVVKAIGIHQSRDQAKRQVVAIDRMGGEQRPAGLELDGPETVEFDGGLPVLCKGRIGKLG